MQQYKVQHNLPIQLQSFSFVVVEGSLAFWAKYWVVFELFLTQLQFKETNATLMYLNILGDFVVCTEI